MKEEITLYYKIENNKRIRLFGNNFVRNNKDKCKLKINEIEKELNIYYVIENEEETKNQNTLIIKLVINKTLTSLQCMFENCNSLLPTSDISKLDASKVTDMSWMFYKCNYLSKLPDISNLNTSNVTNMDSIFYLCESL